MVFNDLTINLLNIFKYDFSKNRALKQNQSNNILLTELQQ